MDCVSEKAENQPLGETAVTDKESTSNESDCLDGEKLVDKNVADNSSDQIPETVTVVADEDSQTFKTSKSGKFTRTISPPTLGTLRSCFSWPGSLGEFSRTPSPSPSTALQQFHRKGDSPSSQEVSDVSQVKSDGSDDEAHPLHEVDLSSRSQENIELSPRDLNASKLSQPCNKDSDSEVSHAMKPLFSNSHVKENKVFII